eukprot:TRINITY_DN12433_c0_g1_i1.p1 TRINITY_DN12433_c0_g1~~TRINITY_DN12433_c0_g1_i1.p1  ORF type:complete len:387 (-),score=56.55 TRINITY_DN12433_c0_g1_i1:104-1204(-)
MCIRDSFQSSWSNYLLRICLLPYTIIYTLIKYFVLIFFHSWGPSSVLIIFVMAIHYLALPIVGLFYLFRKILSKNRNEISFQNRHWYYLVCPNPFGINFICAYFNLFLFVIFSPFFIFAFIGMNVSRALFEFEVEYSGSFGEKADLGIWCILRSFENLVMKFDNVLQSLIKLMKNPKEWAEEKVNVKTKSNSWFINWYAKLCFDLELHHVGDTFERFAPESTTLIPNWWVFGDLGGVSIPRVFRNNFIRLFFEDFPQLLLQSAKSYYQGKLTQISATISTISNFGVTFFLAYTLKPKIFNQRIFEQLKKYHVSGGGDFRTDVTSEDKDLADLSFESYKRMHEKSVENIKKGISAKSIDHIEVDMED